MKSMKLLLFFVALMSRNIASMVNMPMPDHYRIATNEYQKNKAVYDGILQSLFNFFKNGNVRKNIDQCTQANMPYFTQSMNAAQKQKTIEFFSLLKEALVIMQKSQVVNPDPALENQSAVVTQKLDALLGAFGVAVRENPTIAGQFQELPFTIFIPLVDALLKALQ